MQSITNACIVYTQVKREAAERHAEHHQWLYRLPTQGERDAAERHAEHHQCLYRLSKHGERKAFRFVAWCECYTAGKTVLITLLVEPKLVCCAVHEIVISSSEIQNIYYTLSICIEISALQKPTLHLGI